MKSKTQHRHKRFLPKLAMVAALLLGSGVLPAALAGQGPEAPGWWSNARVVETLHLSAEQVSRIETLIYDSSGMMIDLRAKIAKASLELDRLLRTDDLNDDRVQATIDIIADSKCTIEREKLSVRVAVAKVLDSDQRAQLREVLKRAKTKRNRFKEYSGWNQRQEQRRERAPRK